MRLGVEQLNCLNLLCNEQVETAGNAKEVSVVFKQQCRDRQENGIHGLYKAFFIFNVDTVVVQRSQFAHNTIGELQDNAAQQLHSGCSDCNKFDHGFTTPPNLLVVSATTVTSVAALRLFDSQRVLEVLTRRRPDNLLVLLARRYDVLQKRG